MAEMLIQSENLTSIADKIRVLNGTTAVMGLDAMATNVGNANTEVSSQTDLLAQIQSALEGKTAGGGGASKETCSVSLSNDLGGFACTYLSSNDDSLVYIPDFFNETLSTYKNSKLIILSNQYFSDIGFGCDSDASYTEEYSAIGAVTTFTLTEDSHYIHFYEEDPFGGWG